MRQVVAARKFLGLLRRLGRASAVQTLRRQCAPQEGRTADSAHRRQGAPQTVRTAEGAHRRQCAPQGGRTAVTVAPQTVRTAGAGAPQTEDVRQETVRTAAGSCALRRRSRALKG